MPNPWSWSRDPGFYGAPVIKSVLVLTGTASLCQALSVFKSTSPTAWLILRVWSLPSFGMWLVAALVLYQCRIIEWRRGSFKTASDLVLSTVISSILYSALFWSSDIIHRHTGWSVSVVPGLVIYLLLGSLIACHMTSVKPSHSTLTGLPVSSNIPLYILAAVSSSCSVSAGTASVAGILGGWLVRTCKVSLPRPPLWLTTPLYRVVCHEPPPYMYSGASLQVQSQQRTDELERLMTSMYNRQQQQRRRLVIGFPVLQPPQAPPQHKVQQLVSMGFSQQDSSQALRRTGGNVEAALTLLTTQVS